MFAPPKVLSRKNLFFLFFRFFSTIRSCVEGVLFLPTWSERE